MKTLFIASALVTLFATQASASAKFLYSMVAEGESMQVKNLNMDPLYRGITDNRRDTLVCTYKDAQDNLQSFEFGYNPCDEGTFLSIHLELKTPQGSHLTAGSEQLFQDHKSINVNADLSVDIEHGGPSVAMMAMSATQYIRLQSKDPSLPNIAQVQAVSFDPALRPDRQGAGVLNCQVVQRAYECAR